MHFVTVFLFCIFASTSGLSTCKKEVIKKIEKANNCPTGALSKLNALSPFTFAFNPKGTVPATVKCVNGAVDKPTSGFTPAHVYVYYKDESRNRTVINYRQKEDKWGHIVEYDAADVEYQIYDLNVEGVFCYYRCRNDQIEGPDFSACTVPVSKAKDSKTKSAIQECKKKLMEVGVDLDVTDLELCQK